MGTDIYLKWNGQKEDEAKDQVTGFSINAGNRGYLRASIGMHKENSVLRDIFPERYWKGEGAEEYDFDKNRIRCVNIIKGYILTVITGIEVTDTRETHQQQREMADKIALLFEGINAQVKKSGGLGFESSIMWANSLLNFFDLGLQKQKEGKNPTVYISW
jgi:hypothetical protein